MPSLAKLAEFKFTAEEHAVAKAIYESMYPDARWENLYIRRDMRFVRLCNARAAIRAYEEFKNGKRKTPKPKAANNK